MFNAHPRGTAELKRRRQLPPPLVLGTLESAAVYKRIVYFKWGAQYLYVPHNGSSLSIVDQSLSVIGTITDTPHMSNASDVVLNDAETMAWVICESGTNGNCVTCFNITNKAAPLFVQQHKGLTAGTSLAGASCGERDGDLLFVPTITRNSVAIIQCDQVTGLMTWVAEYRPGSLSSCRRVSLDRVNKLCYFACDVGNRVGAFSYATPAAPTGELWASTTDVQNARGIYYIETSKQLWVVATGVSPFLGTISVYDCANPGVRPPRIGLYVGVGSTGSGPTNFQSPRSMDFVTVGARRYGVVVAESARRILVLDITDPGRMFPVSQRRDSVNLNEPMDCRFGPDGALYSGNFSSNAISVMGVTKWDLRLAA